MTLRHSLAAALLVAAVSAPAASCAWDLVLPDSVQATGPTLRLGELASGPVPAPVADLVVCETGRPGTTVTVERRGLLRRLVSAGLARGVRFRGAEKTVVVNAGSAVDDLLLQESVRRRLQPLVPAATAGAPASWFELDLPTCRQAVTPEWRVEVERTEPLAPGRNLVRCELVDGRTRHAFTATATLHAYGETAAAARRVVRGEALLAEHFVWTWRDLAEARRDLVVGRAALAGASAARTFAPGDVLRRHDLVPTPLVRTGDLVELRVARGGVSVSVAATARQDGTLGQTIPVRNELTGRLRNARVAGPGIVEWRN